MRKFLDEVIYKVDVIFSKILTVLSRKVASGSKVNGGEPQSIALWSKYGMITDVTVVSSLEIGTRKERLCI